MFARVPPVSTKEFKSTSKSETMDLWKLTKLWKYSCDVITPRNDDLQVVTNKLFKAFYLSYPLTSIWQKMRKYPRIWVFARFSFFLLTICQAIIASESMYTYNWPRCFKWEKSIGKFQGHTISTAQSFPQKHLR